jgi:hypothetical protein
MKNTMNRCRKVVLNSGNPSFLGGGTGLSIGLWIIHKVLKGRVVLMYIQSDSCFSRNGHTLRTRFKKLLPTMFYGLD